MFLRQGQTATDRPYRWGGAASFRVSTRTNPTAAVERWVGSPSWFHSL
ncbi:unnamed protein product [Ectocarpus sp. 8 AP-2014]